MGVKPFTPQGGQADSASGLQQQRSQDGSEEKRYRHGVCRPESRSATCGSDLPGAILSAAGVITSRAVCPRVMSQSLDFDLPEQNSLSQWKR
jgi:hypothetical protein